MYLKLFLLLYVDDTILFSDSSEDLQYALNIFDNYCHQWKLSVNNDKSKVVIFSKGGISKNTNLLLWCSLDIVNEYKYLGIFSSKKWQVS